MRSILMAAAFVALASAAIPARADCVDDIARVKVKLSHEHDKQVAAAVRKELRRAEKEAHGSESECRNAVVRAYRAFHVERTAEKGEQQK